MLDIQYDSPVRGEPQEDGTVKRVWAGSTVTAVLHIPEESGERGRQLAKKFYDLCFEWAHENVKDYT